MIQFTPEEQQLMARLSIVGGWDEDEATPLKAKIKPFLLQRTVQCCCYCRRSMHGWHTMTIDVEHVLPKGNGHFPQFTFEIRNLSTSCKRCNMGIKRSDISFYLGGAGQADPFRSEYYEFIHPNLDVANDHLKIVALQVNDKTMVKYQIIDGSAKGNSTYHYFELDKIETNSFDEAQGLAELSVSEALPAVVSQELKAVLDTI